MTSGAPGRAEGLTPGEIAELRNLFTAGVEGVDDGHTLSGYTVAALRQRKLARRGWDMRNYITDAGADALFGASDE